MVLLAVAALTLVALIAAPPRVRAALAFALLLVLLDLGVFWGSGAWDCNGACSTTQNTTSVLGIVLLAALVVIDFYAIAVRLFRRRAAPRR